MFSKSQSPLMKWGIFLGLSAAYLLGVILLLPVIGSPITILSGFVVAAAGWYFGVAGGISSSLALIITNYFLITVVGGYSLNEKVWGGQFVGFTMLLLIGAVAGRLRYSLEESSRVETQLRTRERYLTLLKITTSDILNNKRPGDKYYSLLTHLVNLFIADYGYLVRWDVIQEKAILITSTIWPEQDSSDAAMESIVSAITESALQDGRILVINDVPGSQYAASLALPREFSFPVKSALCIPYITQGHKLGATVLAYNTPRQFTSEELYEAQQATDQIALVLWTVQQEVEIQKRLKETNALARIGRALSETERTGPNTVLQLIVESARELIPHTEQAVIHLLDNEEDALISQAALGFSDDDEQSRNQFKMQLGEGIAGQVIKEGVTINVADIKNDPRFVSMGNEPGYRSLLVAPIQIKGKQIGTISVQSKDTNAFSEGEADLLKALGTEAAVAIENAHLLESTQQALNETNALYHINQGLVASLDPQELLQDVVELLKKNFGYYHVQIYVVEPETGDFILRAGSGEIGRQLMVQGYRLRAGEGVVGYTAETDAPFFTNDVDRLFSFVRTPLLPDTKSELTVPVKIEGRILGLLDIQQVPPATLSQRDIQLVSAVANQLAIALHKANLYANLQTSLQTEKTMRDQLVQNERLTTMGRLLASVSHELNNPLQAIQNALFLLREEKGISPQGKQDLDIVLSESERMAALIARLRATYRPAQIEDFQPTQVNDLIEDVYALIATHLRHNEISFEFHPEPNLPAIQGLSDQIRQVLLNLLINAVEAMTTGGRLIVSTQCLKEADEILLKVSDNGKGIDYSILPNIFDAFVTNKESGTGLGLTITYDIIVKHRGRIQAENNPQGGATFSVWLPCGTRERA
ncbi:MAG: GAF domain-containing protein [Chloroflexi bacterium]|nr:GAF domain-containing protein [Chloroflexota bacterium]